MLGDLPLIWFASTSVATRAALGLSSRTLGCDRMSHLFQVEPDDEALILRWGDVKMSPEFERYLPGARRLEAVRGTRPGIWAVALTPVRVFEVATRRQ